MKIIRPDAPAHVKGAQSGTPADRGKTQDFARILEKARSVEPGAVSVKPAGGLLEPLPANGIFFEARTDDASIALKISEGLDLLDRYAADLGNPEKTLKDVAPLLDRLSELADKVEAERVAGMDSELSGIAGEFLLAVRAEEIRFSRGDYVDQGR